MYFCYRLYWHNQKILVPKIYALKQVNFAVLKQADEKMKDVERT